MPADSLTCPNCRAPWTEGPAELAALTQCPWCHRPVTVEVFPALTRPLASGAAGETIVVEGESACFYHPQKRAVVPCSACGRFLCALCDLELNGEHVCPSCLETGQRKGKFAALESQRMLHDNAALSLAILGPLLTCGWGAILTAPITLGLVIYGWNKPGSLIPRTRIRYYVAGILAVLQLGGWGLLVYHIARDVNG